MQAAPPARADGPAQRPGPRGSVHRFVPRALRPLTVALGRLGRELQYRAMNRVTRVHPKPLLVLGNQKSGTSAIAGLLARATGKSVTLDLAREVWRPSFQRVPSGELSFDDFVARNRWGFSREIVKEPNLTLFHPQLRARFPESSFVFVVRDPRDNIRSILNRLKLPGDLEALPDDALDVRVNPVSTPGWAWVFDPRWRGLPKGHYIEVLARRWQFCVDVYLENADSMQLCRYEEFRSDKVGTIERLARELGLAVVADPSDRLDYPFQPPGDNSSRWQDFFGPSNLARIERICAPGIAALGYPPSRSRR